MNDEHMVPTVDWESLGFTRVTIGEPPYDRTGFVRHEGQLAFRLCYGVMGVIAEVGIATPPADSEDKPHQVREHHMVREDEALGWFGVWIPSLSQRASDEMRERFRRGASHFRRKWPLAALEDDVANSSVKERGR